MAKILVTGATGFIGSHLTRRLIEQGHQVRCLVRPSPRTAPLRELGVTLIEGDLLAPDRVALAAQGTDYVYHLAGLTSAHRSRTLLAANGQGTRHVVEACARLDQSPILLYVSSIAAAGPTSRNGIRTEQDAPQPVSNYGRSKRAGEIALERLAGDVPATIVRPGIVFGPNDREMLPLFRCVYRMRFHAVAGLQSPRLSLIYVEDLIDLVIQAAQIGTRLPGTPSNGSAGKGIYFACRPEHPDYFQFGRLLQQALDLTYLTYLHIPAPAPWLVGAVSQIWSGLRGTSNSLNIDKIREATAASWVCSGAAAERDLAFQATGSLLEQLRTTVNWYREQGWL